MASEVGSVEDVVTALLEYLVDPLLPLTSSALKEAPNLAKEHSVAKQLHAVVLLYNYYQRKQNPEALYLDFESFCKLAVTLRPALGAYMKFMNQSIGSKDMDNDLSVTEKAIQDACNISHALDASKDVPSVDNWLISKVSVLLLDFKRENCWMNYNSVTDGVWSLLEISLEVANADLERVEEGKPLNKKRRTSVKPVPVGQNVDDSGFQQLAFFAVKDATGISQSNLVVLEKHVVYSLSKEKTACYFYIMRCTQSINQDNRIPVKDTFESLQGPLVISSCGSWLTTEVVEYFHLLPYASIMSAFFLRVWPIEEVGHSVVGQVASDVIGSQSNEIVDVRGDEPTGVNLESLNGDSNEVGHEKNRDYEDSSGEVVYATIKRPRTPGEKANKVVKSTKSCKNDFSGMDIDACIPCSKNEYKTEERNLIMNKQKKRARVNGGQTTKSGVVCKAARIDEEKAGKEYGPSTSSPYQNVISEAHTTLVPCETESKDSGDLQTVLASKEKALTQTALRVLLQKREKLCHQRRNIEDEIALSDKRIQKFLDGGNTSALNLETVLGFCNEMCLKDRAAIQENDCQRSKEVDLLQPMSGMKSSNALLTLRRACDQDLDHICRKNSWAFPSYSVSTTDGGFRAKVTVNEGNFECSCEGDVHPLPSEARESAAFQLITKLQTMMAVIKTA